MNLIAELKRRKVFKIGAAYVVVAWLVVQVASIAFPAFDAPSWVLRVFILIAFLGLPIALVFAAIYACGIWLVHASAGWFVVGLGRNGAEYSVLIIACLLAHAWAHRNRSSVPT